MQRSRTEGLLKGKTLLGFTGPVSRIEKFGRYRTITDTNGYSRTVTVEQLKQMMVIELKRKQLAAMTKTIQKTRSGWTYMVGGKEKGVIKRAPSREEAVRRLREHYKPD